MRVSTAVVASTGEAWPLRYRASKSVAVQSARSVEVVMGVMGALTQRFELGFHEGVWDTDLARARSTAAGGMP